MAAVVGALRAVLSLESAAFTDGLKRAQGGLQRFSAQAQAIGNRMQKIGAIMSVAGVAMAAGIRRGINAADDMGDMAEKFGIPVEALSKLAYAAEVSGVSTEVLGASLRKLSDKMADAAGGSKSALAVFERLGVSVTDASGQMRSTEDVLIDLSAAIAAMPDGAEKAALAMDLFGKTGTDMIPLLNKGRDSIAAMTAEAAELGLVISQDTADAAGDFNDNMARLGSIMDGVMIQLAAELAPVLRDIGDQLIELAKWFANLSPEVRETLAVIAGIVVVGGPLIIGLGMAVSAVGKLTAAFVALGAALLANPILAIMAAIAVGALLIWWNWDWLKEKMIAGWDAIAEKVGPVWETIKRDIGGAIDWVQAKWVSFVEKIEAAIQLAKDAAKAIGDALSLGREEMNSGNGYGGMSGAMDGNPAVIEDMNFERGRGIGNAIGDGMAAGIQEASLRNGQAFRDAFGRPIQTAEDLYDIASPSKVFRQIGEYITQGLALGVRDGAAEPIAAITELGTEMVDTTKEAADQLRDAGKGLFGDWVTGAKSAGEALAGLAQRMADMLADSAFDMIFGKGGIGGGIWDGLATALGFAKGGVFQGGNVTAFAKGGVVGMPTMFGMPDGLGLMGEAGPEAIMPLTRGPGGRLGVQAMGGGQTVRIVVEEGNMFASRVEAISDGRAIEVVRQYDAEIAPVSRGRAAREVG